MKTRFDLSAALAALLLLLFPTLLHSQNALHFNAGNDIVQTTYPGVLGSANRTFEAWINVSANITANACITDYGLNAVGSRNTFLVNPNYQLSFISGGTNANISSSAGAVPAGQWVHVAFVLNNGFGFFYVNGVQVGTGNLTTVNTPSGNANLRIGQRVSGGNIPFRGAIDEVRIWDVARTPAEIMANMNTEFCAIPPSLKAYYKFNQGTAGGNNAGLTTLTDNSGNSNDGTLSGFALSGTISNWVSGASISGSNIIGGTDTLSACIPYVTLGNQTISASGMYQDTVLLPSGCDSIYTLDFTALNQSTSTISPSACNSYVAPSGAVFTNSGNYQDTIPNALGCDSIVTINLTILTSSQSSTTAFGCDTFVSPSGQVWTTPGTYQDTIPNSVGCDSFMTINLVIQSSVATSLTDSACGSYTSGLGNTYTQSGTYTEVGQAANGCDSTVTLNLSVVTTDTTVSQTGNTLTSNESGASYQWIDCGSQSIINGAVAQSFTPTASGNYAVVVQNGFCTDTSACVAVTVVGIGDPGGAMVLYPNPTSGRVSIDAGGVSGVLQVRVVDVRGQVVRALEVDAAQSIQLDLGEGAGLYTVEVQAAGVYRVFRVVKVE